MRRYTDRIVLRLHGGLEPLRGDETLRTYAARLNLGELERTLGDLGIDAPPIPGGLPPIRSRRLVQPRSLPTGGFLTRTGAEAAERLARYTRIDVSPMPGRIPAILNALGQRVGRELETVYRELRVQPASGPAVTTDDTFFGKQGHLSAAPYGIDAVWVWQQGYAGGGIGFADVEAGWQLPHEDLPPGLALLAGGGLNDINEADHGTAALGVVCALDNAKGVLGVCPTVAQPLLVSYWPGDNESAQDIANAIDLARAALTATGAPPHPVLLLEVESSGDSQPVEVMPEVRDAILTATSAGVVVIEPAGNGNLNLDTDVIPVGWEDFSLDPYSPYFIDSGAVMVGAATVVQGVNAHPRWQHPTVSGVQSNWGQRVDCYAWGEGVTTTGEFGGAFAGSGVSESAYTEKFNGTSSASAIIAGAAVLLREISNGASPPIVRNWLRAASGTPSSQPVNEPIGYMANLRVIVQTELSAPPPDVYVRDYVTDDGVVPTSGTVSHSPDIIVRAAAEVDPRAAFGQGSGQEDNPDLSVGSVTNADHWVYVRLRNRGAGVAQATQVTVYWSPPATLLDPSVWRDAAHTIGSTQVDVDPAAGLVVTAGIPWGAAAIPAAGHYCFVAVAEHPEDPMMWPADLSALGFANFVRNNNNVAWRNFNVVVVANDGGGASIAPAEAQFAMRGAPGEDADFLFEVVRQHPAAEFVLRIPANRFLQPHALHPSLALRTTDTEWWDVPLPARQRVRLPTMRLPAGANLEARVLLPAGTPLRAVGETIAVRQLYNRVEVGRVTMHFRPRALSPG